MVSKWIIGSSKGMIYLNLGTNGTEMGMLLGIEIVVVRTGLILSNILMSPFT